MGLPQPVRTSYTCHRRSSRTRVGWGPGAVPGFLLLLWFLRGKIARTALWGDRGEDITQAEPGQSTLSSDVVPWASLPAVSVSPRFHTPPAQQPLPPPRLSTGSRPHPRFANPSAKRRLGQTAGTARRVWVTLHRKCQAPPYEAPRIFPGPDSCLSPMDTSTRLAIAASPLVGPLSFGVAIGHRQPASPGSMMVSGTDPRELIGQCD